MTAAHTEAHAFEEVDQEVSVGDAIEEVPREEEETDGDGDGDEYDAEVDSEFDPLQQVSQLLITEEGIPIADVLLGIKDALDKLGKIHYKIAQILEAKLA